MIDPRLFIEGGIGRAISKRPARCDGQGCPAGLVLTPDQTHAVHGLGLSSRILEDRVKALRADTAVTANAIRKAIEVAGAEAVIREKSNRRAPVPHVCEKCRWRNPVEPLVGKLKNWRRVAARDVKTR